MNGALPLGLGCGYAGDLNLTGHSGEDVVVLCTKASKIEVEGDQNISDRAENFCGPSACGAEGLASSAVKNASFDFARILNLLVSQ